VKQSNKSLGKKFICAPAQAESPQRRSPACTEQRGCRQKDTAATMQAVAEPRGLAAGDGIGAQIILIIFTLCLLTITGWAQNYTQTVKGRVTDRDTKTPLPGATVVILKTSPQLGTTTDDEGYFKLEKVPVGRYDLRITYLGYEEITLQQLNVATGKELVLNIEMAERVREIESITISANGDKEKPLNDMATVSARTFNVEETQRYAASFNDPARMAVSFAGVSTSNDASNEIIVRGNSARGMLWRVEGIEIPNPNHFSNGEGGSGGGISILSSQVLGSSDFFTGAFPAEYGNALSGVFDIRFRKGNYDKREYAFQVGVLGLQASLEGPFSKKYNGSYLINYRYSTLVLLNALGLKIVDNALVPEFQDLSFNFNFPTKKAGTFTFWGLGGISKAGEIAKKDSLQWERRSDRFEDHNFQVIGATGITHTYLFSNQKTYLKTILAFSGDNLEYRLDSLDQNYSAQTAYQDRYTYYTGRANMYVNHKFNARHVLRAGVIYSQYFYNILSRGLILQTGQTGTFVNEDGNTGLLQTYAQWKFRITDNIDLNTGFHQTLFLLNNRFAIEPRLGLQWKVKPRHTINLGAGMHSRIEPISNYLSRSYTDTVNYIQPNRNLDLTRSVHAVAGYDWSFWENMRLKTEVYFQYLYNVPVDTAGGSIESILNASAGVARIPYENKGLGRNYGLEITIEKFFSKNYFFLLTGSLFQSEYSMGDGVWYNTRFNGNYMLNALGGYELRFGKSRQSSWGINARIIWRGGNRYTPIDTAASILQGREVLFTDQAYSKRVPDYFRMDISTHVRFNFRKWAFSISAEVQNVINRLNVNRYFYDPYTQEVRTAFMFGIMPVFNFKFEF
jgi:hypothetical protein